MILNRPYRVNIYILSYQSYGWRISFKGYFHIASVLYISTWFAYVYVQISSKSWSGGIWENMSLRTTASSHIDSLRVGVWVPEL